MIAGALNKLGDVARCRAQYEEAAAFYAESLALYRELGNKWDIAHALYNLGYVALFEENAARAAALFSESLMLRRELGSQWEIAERLAGAAGAVGGRGEPAQAARLYGAAEALRDALGGTVCRADQADYDRNVATVRKALGETAFRAAWADGRALAPEAAITRALAALQAAGPEPNAAMSEASDERRRLPAGDLTDTQWDRVVPLLPPSRGRRGRPAQEHRRVINGILWFLRSEAPWRELPARYGPWQTCHHRYLQWRRRGLWEQIVEALQPAD